MILATFGHKYDFDVRQFVLLLVVTNHNLHRQHNFINIAINLS